MILKTIFKLNLEKTKKVENMKNDYSNLYYLFKKLLKWDKIYNICNIVFICF